MLVQAQLAEEGFGICLEEQSSGSTARNGTALSARITGGENIFVHHTGIAGSGFKSLDEGQKVTYEVARGVWK